MMNALWNLGVMVAVMGCALVGRDGWSRETIVEVPLSKVYVPRTGFDDNDRVEAVARGHLPNPCYSLGGASVEKSADGKQFVVRQYATREMNGPCEGKDRPDLGDPVPYLSTLELGSLQQGDYDVRIRRDLRKPEPVTAASFHVEAALSPNVDNFRYASISAIETTEVFAQGEPIELMISGTLQNTCDHLDLPFAYQVQGDVIVVRPDVIMRLDMGDCRRELRSFKAPLNLGALEPGEYLVHVRTRDGKAVYRAFQVSTERAPARAY